MKQVFILRNNVLYKTMFFLSEINMYKSDKHTHVLNVEKYFSLRKVISRVKIFMDTTIR